MLVCFLPVVLYIEARKYGASIVFHVPMKCGSGLLVPSNQFSSVTLLLAIIRKSPAGSQEVYSAAESREDN